MDIIKQALEEIEDTFGFKKSSHFEIVPSSDPFDLLPYCDKKKYLIKLPFLCSSLLNLKNSAGNTDDAYLFVLAHKLAQYGCYNDGADVLSVLGKQISAREKDAASKSTIGRIWITIKKKFRGSRTIDSIFKKKVNFEKDEALISTIQMKVLLLHEIAHLYFHDTPTNIDSYIKGIDSIIEGLIEQYSDFDVIPHIHDKQLIKLFERTEYKERKKNLLDSMRNVGKRQKEELACDLFAIWHLKKQYKEFPNMMQYMNFIHAMMTIADIFDIDSSVRFSCNTEEDYDPADYEQEAYFRSIRRSSFTAAVLRHFSDFFEEYYDMIELDSLAGIPVYENLNYLEKADMYRDNLKKVRESGIQVLEGKDDEKSFNKKVNNLLLEHSLIDDSIDLVDGVMQYKFG